MRDRVRGWVTGLERDLCRNLVRDWLKCWAKGRVIALEVRLSDIRLDNGKKMDEMPVWRLIWSDVW